MKKNVGLRWLKWNIFFILIIPISQLHALDWECEKCPPRTVALYDCDVQVAKPAWGDSSLDLTDWLSMFFVAGGIHSKLVNEDPSSECISFYDGQFVNAADSLGDIDSLSYSEDVDWFNLPPPGPIDYVDYLVVGSVSGTGGYYVINVSLQAAGTRETVASETVDYNLSESGSENGKRAAEFLVPLMETIREFEKQKRDETQTVAIRVKEDKVEVVPEKVQVDVDESIDVTVRLTDCDDVSLENRSIQLSATGGSFSPDSVVTDENGEATAVFTAGNTPGWGLLIADHTYRYPFRQESVMAWGEAPVSIDQPPVNVWQVSATFTTTVMKNADTTWKWTMPGGYTFRYENTYSETIQGNGRLIALIPNECGNGAFCYSMNEDPIFLQASGSMSERSCEKKKEYLSGEIPIFGGYLSGKLASGSYIRNDRFSANLTDGSF